MLSVKLLGLALAIMIGMGGCKVHRKGMETTSLSSEERTMASGVMTMVRNSESWRTLGVDLSVKWERLDSLGVPRERLVLDQLTREEHYDRDRDTIVERDTIYVDREVLVEHSAQSEVRVKTSLWQTLWLPLVAGILLGVGVGIWVGNKIRLWK